MQLAVKLSVIYRVADVRILSERKVIDVASLLHLEGIRIPPNSLILRHGYLQHPGPKWNGHQELLYHIYVKANDYNQKGSVSFAYSANLKPERPEGIG